MRIKKGYTHADMAKLLNISKPFYWQIENNKRRLSYNMAFNISQILKTTPDKIFYEEFKNNSF
ncbi:MAG: helix-turn-helix transcriptional regulator [Bacilli bacterium]|nr:helix-turn-helix transcriptional regulator [Bacilli bacterium]